MTLARHQIALVNLCWWHLSGHPSTWHGLSGEGAQWEPCSTVKLERSSWSFTGSQLWLFHIHATKYYVLNTKYYVLNTKKKILCLCRIQVTSHTASRHPMTILTTGSIQSTPVTRLPVLSNILPSISDELNSPIIYSKSQWISPLPIHAGIYNPPSAHPIENLESPTCLLWKKNGNLTIIQPNI